MGMDEEHIGCPRHGDMPFVGAKTTCFQNKSQSGGLAFGFHRSLLKKQGKVQGVIEAVRHKLDDSG